LWYEKHKLKELKNNIIAKLIIDWDYKMKYNLELRVHSFL